jgi:hypothetical protein
MNLNNYYFCNEMKLLNNTRLFHIVFSGLLILITPFSCRDKYNHVVPYVLVDFEIDTQTTFYNELNSVGGYVYLTGGYKGIIVYKLNNEEFLAYDRCCTFDPENPCERVEMEDNRLFLVDSCCGSRFIILDGTPHEGPAKMALRQYRTFFDGRYLRVMN